MVIESGSKKTVAASAKVTPCFRRLASAFSGSNSNSVVILRNIRNPVEKRNDVSTITARMARDALTLLQHGQNISGRIFEPGDRRAAVVEDSFVVRFDLTVVVLKAHAFLLQLIDGLVDV